MVVGRMVVATFQFVSAPLTAVLEYPFTTACFFLPHPSVQFCRDFVQLLCSNCLYLRRKQLKHTKMEHRAYVLMCHTSYS